MPGLTRMPVYMRMKEDREQRSPGRNHLQCADGTEAIHCGVRRAWAWQEVPVLIFRHWENLRAIWAPAPEIHQHGLCSEENYAYVEQNALRQLFRQISTLSTRIRTTTAPELLRNASSC